MDTAMTLEQLRGLYLDLMRDCLTGMIYDDPPLEWKGDALEEIARIAEEVNERTQNIGARRLHTIFEKLLEDPLFQAPDDLKGRVVIDRAYVVRKLAKVAANEGSGRYTL